MRKKLLLILTTILLAITTFTTNVFANDLGDSPTLYDVLHTRPDFAYGDDYYNYGWYNEKYCVLYCDDEGNFTVDSGEFSVDQNVTLTKDGNNYKYTTTDEINGGNIDLLFIMNNNLLDYIEVTAPNSQDASGTYGRTITDIRNYVPDYLDNALTNENGYKLFFSWDDSELVIKDDSTVIYEISDTEMVSFNKNNNDTYNFVYNDSNITITFNIEGEPNCENLGIVDATVSLYSTSAVNGTYKFLRAGKEFWLDDLCYLTTSEYDDKIYKVRVNDDLETFTLVEANSSILSEEYYLPQIVSINNNEYLITGIGDDVFKDLSILKKVYIYDPFVNIGSNAFKGCSNLTDLYLYSVTPPTLGSGAFDDCSVDLTIHVLKDSYNAYITNSTWLPYKNIIQPTVIVDDVINTAPGFTSYEIDHYEHSTIWKNENGATVTYDNYGNYKALTFYLEDEDGSNYFDALDSYAALTENASGNYEVSLFGETTEFVMENGVLTSIKLSGIENTGYYEDYTILNGTYIPVTTISSILSTVEGGYPYSVDDETVPDDGWSTPDVYKLYYSYDRSVLYISDSPFYFDPFEDVTLDSDGNYVTSVSVDIFSTIYDIDIKFIMENNALKKIEASMGSLIYEFEPIGNRKPISEILDNYASDFPTTANNGWLNPNNVEDRIYRGTDSLEFSENSYASIYLFFIAKPSGNDYILDLSDISYKFVISDNKLQSIEVSASGGDEFLSGTYSAPISISDILGDSFPQSAEAGFVNKVGKKAYIYNNTLKVGTYSLGLVNVLTKDGDNYSYTYPSSNTKFLFNMINNELNSIEVSGSNTETDNGTYEAFTYQEHPDNIPKGYNGELEFRINAIYTDPDAVIVKINGNPINCGTQYRIAHGSTIVTLLSNYVSSLTEGLYTISIEVPEYIPLKQQFTISNSPSGGGGSSGHVVLNTGVSSFLKNK